MRHRSTLGSKFSVPTLMIVVALIPFGEAQAQGLGRSAPSTPNDEDLVEVQDVAVDGDTRRGNIRGFTVSYRYRVRENATSEGRGLRLVADLRGPDGRKVQTTLRDSLRRDRSGSLRVTSFLVSEQSGRWHLTSFFVPFYILKLHPGPQRVTLALKAERSPSPEDLSAPPTPVKLIGSTSASFEINKPPYRMVQLLVRELEVAAVNTDVSFLRPHKARPDLQWRVTFEGDMTEYLHVSSHHNDRFSANWSQYSRPFPVSEGDRLTLSVVDHDVMSHDDLGVFSFTLDQLVAFGNLQPLLCGGAVHKMVLAPVIVH